MTPQAGQRIRDKQTGRICTFEREERYASTHGTLACWRGKLEEPVTERPFYIILAEEDWEVVG